MGIKTIADLKDGDTEVFLQAEITSKEDVRSVTTKFGETKVCTVKVKDASGEIKYTLWGKETEKAVGAFVQMAVGFINTFRDELQLNKGKKKQ